MQNKQHISRNFSQPRYHVWLWQEFKLCHTGTHHVAFLGFQKKSLEFSITWNKINSSLDLLISYPSITQIQIKHSLPTSFKFRVNLYIKIILSKTRENSRLKIRYLKQSNYLSFPFQEIVLRVLIIYLALKVNQTHFRHY